jgi:hypothetical protein
LPVCPLAIAASRTKSALVFITITPFDHLLYQPGVSSSPVLVKDSPSLAVLLAALYGVPTLRFNEAIKRNNESVSARLHFPA